MKRKILSILTAFVMTASFVNPVLADKLQGVTIISDDDLSIDEPKTNITLNDKTPGGTWSATVSAKIISTGNNHVLPATVYFTAGTNQFSIYFEHYEETKSVTLTGSAQSSEGPQTITFLVTSTDSNNSADLNIQPNQEEVKVSFNVVNPAPVIVSPTVTWPTATITYGETLTASSFVNGSAEYDGVNVPGTFSFTGIPTSLLNASETGYDYNVTFDPTDTTKYNSVTGGISHVNVSKRDINVTADAQSKTYGDIDPSLTFKITSGSLVEGDSFTGSLARSAGENVGTYVINQGSLTAGDNYNLTFGEANLAVTARPIAVTADATSKIYGDAEPRLTYQITSGSLVEDDSFTGSLERSLGENVGTYAINQGSLTAGDNYNLTYTGANLIITARPIAVTADTKSKVYGDVDPSLTYKITSGSLVAGDSFTGSLTRVSGENAGTYEIKQGSLTAGDNYNLTFVGANFTINYLYGGILQPINPDNTSVFKLGSTVPVKFQLKDYKGNVVPTVASVMPTISVKKLSNNISGTVTETSYTDVAMAGTTFKYDDAAKQYVFNLSTKGWTAGTYEIRVIIENCVGVVPVQISSK